MTLHPRERFLEPPPPFTVRDVYPWRHNRALSYLRRPLVTARWAVGEQRLLFGRGACYSTKQVLGDLALTGRLGAEQSAVRGASIELQRRHARRVEDDIADRIEASGPWICRRRVRKLGRWKLERKPGEEVGDIDVLAADRNARILACIEVKALAGAIAPHQLRNELETTFAPAARKPSAAMRLLERAALVGADITSALRSLGFDDDPSEWRVGACIVTDYEILSSLLDACPVPVIPLSQLPAILADRALGEHLAWGVAG